MLRLRRAGGYVQTALVVAVLVVTILAVPAVASATTFSFKPNQLVNGNASTSSNTVPAAGYPMWLFIASDTVSGAFMSDADGWGMKPLNGWTATPVAYSEFYVTGFYSPWSSTGFDVRNAGAVATDITVSATAGGSPVSSTVTIEPGVEHVTLSGFSNIAASTQIKIAFSSTTALSFNNFDIVAFSLTAPPTVTTGSASSISYSAAQVSGTVTDAGGTSVTERGIVWSTSPSPTTSSSKVVVGSGTGTFSGSLTGLDSWTTYYARAYATNSNGTSYGAEITFKTADAPPKVVASASSPWALALMAVGALGLVAFALRRREDALS